MAVQAMEVINGWVVPYPKRTRRWEGWLPRPKRANKQPHCHCRHSAWRGNTLRDRAGVSRGHSRSARTQGPNVATPWRSRANLDSAIEPDRGR